MFIKTGHLTNLTQMAQFTLFVLLVVLMILLASVVVANGERFTQAAGATPDASAGALCYRDCSLAR